MGSTTKVNLPETPSVGQVREEDLASQIKSAGQVLGAEQELRPQYLGLDLQTMNQSLEGVGGQPGLIQQWEGTLAPAIARQERAQREAELGLVEDLGARARSAYEAGSPEQAGLGRQLAGIASADLERDDILDPRLRREVQQSYRNAATARGMAYNPSSAAEEAYFTGLKAEQVRDKRRAFAGNVYGLLGQNRPEVFQALLGRPASVTGAVPGYGGQAMAMGKSMGPNLIQPDSAAAFDLARAGYQGQIAGQVGQAQSGGAMMGGLFGGMGSIGRGLLGM